LIGIAMDKIDKYKPAVSNTFLLFLAGIVWICAGMMLLILAFSWLSKSYDTYVYLYAGTGIIVALFVHHFGFLKIVDKNIHRIDQMNGKQCLFAFIPWKSYLIILVMITIGTILRHSFISKKDLSVLYIGIGLALILSSIRYIRVFTEKSHGQR